MNNKTTKIMFVGGHSTPAFAVLDELKNPDGTFGYKEKNLEIVWVGEKHNQRGNKNYSSEFSTVKSKYKIKFIDLKSGKLVRAWTPHTFLRAISEFFLIFWGLLKSFFIILNERPDILLSFGGFTAVPLAFWAKLFRKKVITHEQTITSGLANKIISKFSDKVLVSWKSTMSMFPAKKVVFTGNPIRKDIFLSNSQLTVGLDREMPTIYITGGNQGANEINKRIFEIVPKLVHMANVIHQTGSSTVTKDFEKAQKIKLQLPIEQQHRYIVKDFIGPDEIGEVLKTANLLVSRAGANTCSEVLALGKLTIFIPIPWASKNEQYKNAKFVEDIGLGLTLEQSKNLKSSDLLIHIVDGLQKFKDGIAFNEKNLKSIQADARNHVNLDASKQIVQQIFSI